MQKKTPHISSRRDLSRPAARRLPAKQSIQPTTEKSHEDLSNVIPWVIRSDHGKRRAKEFQGAGWFGDDTGGFLRVPAESGVTARIATVIVGTVRHSCILAWHGAQEELEVTKAAHMPPIPNGMNDRMHSGCLQPECAKTTSLQRKAWHQVARLVGIKWILVQQQ